MKERIILVHGWAASPEFAWHPRVADQLRAIGYDVFVPEMPDPYTPRIDAWLQKIDEVITEGENAYAKTHFIGHSIGCQTILRYLQKSGMHAGTCVFVAGWFTLTGLNEAEEIAIAAPWLEKNMRMDAVRTQIERAVALFSDNDEYVPLDENSKVFENLLKAEIQVQTAMDHFDHCSEQPVVVQAFS